MTDLPPVIKVTTDNTYLPPVIKVDGKVIKVK